MIEGSEFSDHASLRLAKRVEIVARWIDETIHSPERRVKISKTEWHYIRAIRESDGRVLKVVVNPSLNPKVIVTAHFDR